MKNKSQSVEYEDCKHLNISKELRTMPKPLPDLPNNFFQMTKEQEDKLRQEYEHKRKESPFMVKSHYPGFEDRQKK